MHATNPDVLQLPTAITAMKGAIAAGQHASVTAGMVEVSALFTAGRRLAAAAIPPDRRLIKATPVTMEYRIIMPPSTAGFNATKVAREIVQKITLAPVEMVFEIQKAIKDSSVATMVANLLVLPPIVDTINTDACVFKYWRFFPVKSRGPHSSIGRTGVALGELTLYDAGMKRINVTEATVGGSCQPPRFEDARCAFDGDLATSWYLLNLRPLQLEFKMAQGIDFYRWATGSVAASKDPLRWRLEASADNMIWKVVDERALFDHQTPTARRMDAGLFKVGCKGAAPLVAAAGATDGSGMSPMLMIVLVLIILMVVAICIGCLLNRRPIFRLAGRLLCMCQRRAATKASQVLPEEQEFTGDGPGPVASKLGDKEPQVFSGALAGQEAQGLLAIQQPLQLDDSAPREEEYEIMVDKGEGTKLAVHFSNFYDDGVSLLIDGIRPGLVESWNDLHPDTIVKVGDRVVDVNGVREAVEQMRAECLKGGLLRMRLVRPGYERVHGIFRRGVKVVINGLSEKTQNNGALAEILRYEQDVQKYLVRLEDSRKKVRLSASNFILAYGREEGPSPDGHGPPALMNALDISHESRGLDHQDAKTISSSVEVIVGMFVTVTSDPTRYEHECKAAGASWPNLRDGRPRSVKMGAMGYITEIDLTDSTVDISDGVRWVPIRALMGFENYRRNPEDLDQACQ